MQRMAPLCRADMAVAIILNYSILYCHNMRSLASNDKKLQNKTFMVRRGYLRTNRKFPIEIIKCHVDLFYIRVDFVIVYDVDLFI